MGTTTRFQIPFPEETDANDYPTHMSQLAAKIDGSMAAWSTGPLGNRPPAGFNGRFYCVSGDTTSSNNGLLFFDDGSAWHQVIYGQPIRLSGTLDGSGNAAIAHPFGAGVVSKLQNVQAFYEGNSGEAVPLTISSIDGLSIDVTGGGAGRHFYVAMTVVDDSMPW